MEVVCLEECSLAAVGGDLGNQLWYRRERGFRGGWLWALSIEVVVGKWSRSYLISEQHFFAVCVGVAPL